MTSRRSGCAAARWSCWRCSEWRHAGPSGGAEDASDRVVIDWVTVGAPRNAPDTEVMAADRTTGYGAVPYKYDIGKFLITNAQYADVPQRGGGASRIPTCCTTRASTVAQCYQVGQRDPPHRQCRGLLLRAPSRAGSGGRPTTSTSSTRCASPTG